MSEAQSDLSICRSHSVWTIAIATGLLLFAAVLPLHAQTSRRWDFNGSGDRQGWEAPADKRGAVMGGSLWLTFAPDRTDPKEIADPDYQVWSGFWQKKFQSDSIVKSPAGLSLPATEVTQVRMRVLNQSSLTDFYLHWRTKEKGWGQPAAALTDWGQPEQSRRCTMKADTKAWQEITCYLDGRWQGTIDQIEILSAQWMLRGDLWIDWIEIGKGAPEPVGPRPDIASNRVIPTITVPGLSRQAFADAYKVLDENLTVDVPIYGMNYPVVLPSPYYAKGGWWYGDSTLALQATKWTHEAFSEDVLRGFHEIQAENPDGRIDFMGKTGIRGQVADVSSFPAFNFDTEYLMARRTRDAALREQIYASLRMYLDWWLSPVKRDAETGLISALFEETGGDLSGAPMLTQAQRMQFARGSMVLAPTDLNVAVAVGAAQVSELAGALGKQDEAGRYRRAFEALSKAINTYLWDDRLGIYANYDLKAHKRRQLLKVSMFLPLRMQIAPPGRQRRLLARLLDPSEFNWGKVPLTSVSMKDPTFVDLKNQHQHSGYVEFGMVNAIWNLLAYRALEESHHAMLAAELNWKTIRIFEGQWNEFMSPSTGEGLGATRFTWAAAQYIQSVIDNLFGVDVDTLHRRLRISPHIPKNLYGKTLALENLILPSAGDTHLSLFITQRKADEALVHVRISGALPEGSIEVALPGSTQALTMPMQSVLIARFPKRGGGK